MSYFDKIAREQRAACKPQEETAEQASRRLHHLERSAHAVSRKITTLYGPTPPLEPELEAFFTKSSADLADQWMAYPRNSAVLTQAGVDAERVRAAISESANAYFYAFMHGSWMAHLRPNMRTAYDNPTVRDHLQAILRNHKTNAAEAKLIAAGVDAIDAHRINGFIIQRCVNIMYFEQHMHVGIKPIQKRPESILAAERQIESLRNYWRTRVDELNGVFESRKHYRSW